MRPDQIQRLQDLSEKLAEVVLEEADPKEWPGAGISLEKLTQQERGDRYWCKKNAAATFSLLERTSSLLTDAKDVRNNRPQDEDDMDKQIRAKEKEAAKLLEKVMTKAASTTKAAARGKT
jgi:hypothetical protein